jgi:hypothetical protein
MSPKPHPMCYTPASRVLAAAALKQFFQDFSALVSPRFVLLSLSQGTSEHPRLIICLERGHSARMLPAALPQVRAPCSCALCFPKHHLIKLLNEPEFEIMDISNRHPTCTLPALRLVLTPAFNSKTLIVPHVD